MVEGILTGGHPWVGPCISAESSIVSPLGPGSAWAVGASWVSVEASLQCSRGFSCGLGLTVPLRRFLTAMPAACAVASSRSSSRKELPARDSAMEALHSGAQVWHAGRSDHPR